MFWLRRTFRNQFATFLCVFFYIYTVLLILVFLMCLLLCTRFSRYVHFVRTSSIKLNSIVHTLSVYLMGGLQICRGFVCTPSSEQEHLVLHNICDGINLFLLPFTKKFRFSLAGQLRQPRESFMHISNSENACQFWAFYVQIVIIMKYVIGFHCTLHHRASYFLHLPLAVAPLRRFF